jgi:hypothetical protein
MTNLIDKVNNLILEMKENPAVIAKNLIASGLGGGALGALIGNVSGRIAKDEHSTTALKSAIAAPVSNWLGADSLSYYFTGSSLWHAFKAANIDPVEFAKEGTINGVALGAFAYAGYKGLEALIKFLQDSTEKKRKK